MTEQHSLVVLFSAYYTEQNARRVQAYSTDTQLLLAGGKTLWLLSVVGLSACLPSSTSAGYINNTPSLRSFLFFSLLHSTYPTLLNPSCFYPRFFITYPSFGVSLDPLNVQATLVGFLFP